MKLVLSIVISFASATLQAKTRVVATLPALAAMAQSVGKDLVDVDALAAPTEDPHFVDPRPNLILKLRDADLVIANGLELEVGWLPPLLIAARNAQVNVGGRGYLEAAAHVTRTDVSRQRIDRSMGDVHPGGNPHFWFDARAAADIMVAIGERLAELDPTNAKAFRTNAAGAAAELRAFAAEQAERFRRLPPDKRRVVTYHRSFPYLFEWLGLEELIAIEPRPGIAPDPAHVAKVLTTMRAEHVHVIVQEEFQPTNTSTTLAQLGQGRLVVLPGGPRLSKGQSYRDFLNTLTEKLHDALAL
jgi:zinc/manganese transport system substrate-binding protein